MLPVITAVSEAMPKKRINCIEYTPSHMHTALNASAALVVAPRVKSAITRFEPTITNTPPSHVEQNIASRRTGREAISPVLRLLYMKLNTAMAASIAMMNAMMGDAKTALSLMTKIKSVDLFGPKLFISVRTGRNSSQPAK